VLQHGQASVAWFSLAALLGIFVLINVGHWYKTHGLARIKPRGVKQGAHLDLPRARVTMAIAVLVALVFSKFFYMASMTSYYTFYLIDRFGVSVQSAAAPVCVSGAVAIGTIAGGPIGDRIGRKAVIWASILGVLPFTLLLPHANLFWTGVLSVPIGIILASAFPAIVVYAQELMPSRVGAVAGLFFGLAFGLGGIGRAVLGGVATRPASASSFSCVRSCLPSACWPVLLPHLKTEHQRQPLPAVTVDLAGNVVPPPR